MRRTKRWLGGSAALLALLAAAWLLWPAALGGRTTYVTTHGISMEPRFHSGDLALIRPADNYRVGDVVAYHSSLLHTVVMHRIVAVHDNRYTFKGDNNTWLDPQPPSRRQLIGKLALRIPAGGTWLRRAMSPKALAVAVFVLLASGGSVAETRRRRKRGTVSRHAAPRARRAPLLESLPAPLRTTAVAAAGLGLAGSALAAVAWTRPVDAVTTTSTSVPRSMHFSYSAHVRRSAAYDGTTVTAPAPVFRKLTHAVLVHYAYRGAPGDIAVAARLSTPSGWRASLPLSARNTFTGNHYDGTVRLDLDAIDARAQAGARATGIPASPLTVTIAATVHTAVGTPFTPSLRTVTPARITAAGHAVAVRDARRLAAALVLLALLAAAAVALLGRRCASGSEGARIRRRYGPLLIPVAPMPTPAGRPIVDVTDFVTLARVAERYGLLVLHWTRSGVDTFIVQDEATTYRYRTGTGIAAADAVGAPVNAPAVTVPGQVPSV
jgi:signal peptidase I